MQTEKRLNEAYKRAKRIAFDQNSRIVFFSDIHRGDDSISDEFTRNQAVLMHALDYYYNKGYTYIELGDGEELWEYPDFKHIRLAHGDIYTVMKKLYDDGRLILIYGNHNIFLKSKRYVERNLFQYYDEYKQEFYELFPGIEPVEAVVLKHRQTKQEILAVHGHQGDWMNDRFWYLSMLLLRYFWRYLHVVGFRNPSSPARNQYKQHKIERNYERWIGRHCMMLICGHTHRPRFPKHRELPYYNTGCCIHTKGITGIEITGDNILMVEWRMMSDQDGTLKMVRTIVRGPEKIERYKKRRRSGISSRSRPVEDVQ